MSDDSYEFESTQLDEILASFLVAEEAGQQVGREELLQRHPDLSDELQEFFSARDRFKCLVRPLSSAIPSEGQLPATLRYVGDYELLEELARGGMGIVYKARQVSLSRIVAVKMLLAGHLATDDDVRRFKEEAAMAASLRHQHIVPIHEVGQHNGHHYFSMDLVEGRNLADVLRTEPPTPTRAAEILKQIADAVDYAHGQGTVHRDLKPSNVLIDDSGRVHVTDFGLAMRVEGGSDLTQSGQVLGTPAYMSPEQAAGQRQLVGPASDIYALGALLYELLTGRPAFRGETVVQMLRQVADAEPLAPRRLNPRVPRDLETICLKCLQKEPLRRYSSAALLSDDLGRFLANEPIQGRPVSRVERACRWSRRNPLIASLAATTITLLAAVAVVATGAYFREFELRKQNESARARIGNLDKSVSDLQATEADLNARTRQLEQELENRENNVRVIEEALTDAGHDLYGVLIELARAQWHAGNIVLADYYLEKCPPPARKRDWHDLKLLFHPPLKSFPGSRCIDVSQDGKRLASAGEDHSVKVWELATGHLIHSLAGHKAAPDALAFSPDGRLLVSVAGHDINLWDLSDGRLIRSLNNSKWPVTADIQFSPDGRYLLAAARRTRHADEKENWSDEVVVWDTTSGHVQRTLAGANRLAFSPNGQFLALELVNNGAGVEVRELANADGTGTPVLKVDAARSPSFDPAGRRLAMVRHGKIEIWSVEKHRQMGFRKLQQLSATDAQLDYPGWSGDGKYIAVVARGDSLGSDGVHSGPNSAIAVFNLLTGERVRLIPRYEYPVHDVAYCSPSWQLATVTPKSLKVWDVAPSKDPTQAILSSIRQQQVRPFDWPMWGGSNARVNTPDGHNIPHDWHIGEFDRKTDRWHQEKSKNIRWVAQLGSQTYGNPVVANGKIFVGTNNAAGYLKRYPGVDVDLGVLLCFDEKTGEFLWQDSNEKLPSGRVHDWPFQGVCSTPVVDGERVWYVSNRGEIVCLDTEGFHDGEDDGPSQGVWDGLFDGQPPTVAAMLNNQKIGSQLKSAIRQSGETRSLVLGRRTAESERWLLGTYEPVEGGRSWEQKFVPCYMVKEDADRIRVFPIDAGNDSSEFCSVPNQRFPDLLSGRVGAELRRAFENSGVILPKDVKLTEVEKDESWMLQAVIDGTLNKFRLQNGAPQSGLRAERLLSPADHHDADVVWRFDMMKELGIHQHNMANCSMAMADGLLFVCTSNGVDESHEHIPAPEAPSFLAMDRETGKVLWTDNSPGKNILHSQWASPSYGVFDGQPQVIFPGGDGWLYSFDPRGDGHGRSKLLWKFDTNPKTSVWKREGLGTRNSIIAFPVIYDGLVYIAVGQDPEHGEGLGHLWCIDPTRRIDGSDVSAELALDHQGNVIPHRRVQAVDVSKGERAIPNPSSAVRWHYSGSDLDGDGALRFEEVFHRTLGMPAIKDDLLYIADFSGLFHCLNAKTGKAYWTYDLLAQCWGSPLLVDGKVYIGDEDGDVAIFRHSADPAVAMNNGEPINEIYMGSSVYMTPIVANNVLYVAAKNRLFAIAEPEP